MALSSCYEKCLRFFLICWAWEWEIMSVRPAIGHQHSLFVFMEQRQSKQKTDVSEMFNIAYLLEKQIKYIYNHYQHLPLTWWTSIISLAVQHSLLHDLSQSLRRL